ncbi:hypothetical protein ACFS6H_02545 [Terrimonas rubra]|uniref:Uncharacterized protein n=1 Tax=Terrimonas rubra TaxID=1035890 RepID=A0ABW6A1Y2_9BACT
MEIHYKIIGPLLMLLACIHLVFPGYFKWKEELSSLSLVNKQMMVIHTFFIALMLFLMGLLCFTSSFDLVHTRLGKTIALGLGIFWAIRLYIQFFGYSSKLWKGKKFETAMHILFSILWVYLSTVFFITALL